MILYVNDNEGILFLRKVQVEVEDRRVGGAVGYKRIVYEEEKSFLEEDILFIFKVFTKICA
tara:strand:+ start:7170 stop:7352 length:183 start_codon:yes stop_codon:yes gene_type:complete